MAAECLRSSKLFESFKIMSDSESHSKLPSKAKKLKLLQPFCTDYRIKYPSMTKSDFAETRGVNGYPGARLPVACSVTRAVEMRMEAHLTLHGRE